MAIVYPNECWPSDAAVASLDGATDGPTGLPYIAKGTGPTSVPSYEVQYNRRLERQNRILATWRQGMVVHEAGLTIGVYPIRFTLGGVHRAFDGVSGVAVPDDSSLVVYLDDQGELQTAPVWPADITSFLPLAAVTTAGGAMTIEDCRGYGTFVVPSLDVGGASDRRIITAHAASVSSGQSDVEVFRFTSPEDLVVDEVQVYCTAVVAGASVEVKENGVSILSSAVAPSPGSVVQASLADTGIAASNPLTIHVTTDGTGSLANLSVTLILKAALAG